MGDPRFDSPKPAISDADRKRIIEEERLRASVRREPSAFTKGLRLVVGAICGLCVLGAVVSAIAGKGDGVEAFGGAALMTGILVGLTYARGVA